MIKKIFFIIIAFLLFIFIVDCEAQNAIIKDVKGEIFKENAEIVIEANCDIEYIDYTLKDPSKIIIDPIGKVYSDLKDVITFAEGPVEKVQIVKGKPEEDLTGNFYPLDFILIELTEPKGYAVRRGRQEIVIDIGGEKKVQISKFIPNQEEMEYGEDFEEPIMLEEEMVCPQRPMEVIEAMEAEEVVLLPSVVTEYPEEEPEGKMQEVIPLAKISTKETKEAPLPLQPSIPLGPVEPIEMVYTIGEGDTLDISVWQHPELDKTVIVRPDGYISFPLVGDIKAKNTTPPQLSSLVRENLSRLIKDPQVTVIVAGFGSKNVFVLGEVVKPGAYPYRGGVNILNAISDAGGWRNSAVLNSVMLVRKAFTDAPEVQRLNVYTLVKKGDFSQNRVLKPGDIVYVPKSFIANIGGFLENLRLSVGAYISETQVFD